MPENRLKIIALQPFMRANKAQKRAPKILTAPLYRKDFDFAAEV